MVSQTWSLCKAISICVPLTSRHRRKCSVHWTRVQWRAVLFTMSPGLASKTIADIFLFVDSLELVFLHDTSVKKCTLIRQCLCLEGGEISLRGRTDLHVFYRGNVLTYRGDILDACVRPYAGAICKVFMLQDYNVEPHRARIGDANLEQETFQCMQ
ncbi:transposable element Tcb2 transposase [Trichonephila clavipes]|nr:transposable element Tcb2 transposase [Trichonephila clavipes]